MCLPRILLLPAVCDHCRWRRQVGARAEVGRQRDQSGQGRQRQRAHSGQWPRRMSPVSAGVSTGRLASHSESLSLSLQTLTFGEVVCKRNYEKV